MTHVVKQDSALLYIELVEHTIVADTQLELGTALQSLVLETVQPCAHVVDLVLDSLADSGWKRIEGFGKSGRPDLKRGGHSLNQCGRCVVN